MVVRKKAVVEERPNGKSMIQAYCRRHTNHFRGDFNSEMIKRRQQKLEAERARLQSPTVADVCPFTAMLASTDEGGHVYL